MTSLLVFGFGLSFVLSFSYKASASQIEQVDYLQARSPSYQKSSVLLLTDSACGSCTTLLKKLPSLCPLKSMTFDILAVGRVKKNKKKLSKYEPNFSIFYSKSRKPLSEINTPATPALLIDQKHFVIGAESILKYFEKNSFYFCKTQTS